MLVVKFTACNLMLCLINEVCIDYTACEALLQVDMIINGPLSCDIEGIGPIRCYLANSSEHFSSL